MHFARIFASSNSIWEPNPARYHERILREYGVVVFPRKGYHRGHDKARLMKEDPSYRITLLKAPLVTISSTEIREGLAAGRDMSRWLM